MKISYSASGKVILSGEHAVVYGKPALISAIDLRLIFSIQSKEKNNNYHLDNGRCIEGNLKIIKDLVLAFLKKKGDSDHFQYQIESAIPIGRGLGSSAAFSVASISAFLHFFSSKIFENKVINELAYQAEKNFHKNPSGVDNTASCYGGLIFYRKEFEFLKSINRLSFSIPKKIEERLFLIDSGKPKETTAEMVEFVKKNYSKKTKEIFDEIEMITKRMCLSLKEKKEEDFEEAVVENEKKLEKLGVVSKKTRDLILSLKSFGVGKITGAGGRKDGSGFILFFARKPNDLIKYCQDNKISYLKFRSSPVGLIRIS